MADDGSPLDISSGAGGALSGMLSIGMGAASGNPLAIASGVIGLGMSLFGGSGQAEAAKKTAQAKKNIAGLEMQQDAVRKQAMEMSANRQQMEVLRNSQRARSLALNSATSQGAQFGSGLQGGFGQVQGAANWNNLGITQNLQSGQQMFGLNSQINQQKMNISDYESSAATSAGISKMGGTLMSSFGPIKNLSGNFAGAGPSTNSGGYYDNGGLSGRY